jgi:plasmid stabilization system protein ParE
MIAFAHASRRLVSRTVATALDLLARLGDVMADVRENRRKLETELFRNRYHHSSKNDDDLPIVR